MATVRCDAPSAIRCTNPARSVVLARAGENQVGNGMAVWNVYWRCEEGHKAADTVDAMKNADPDVQAVVFTASASLEDFNHVTFSAGQ
jgi:hypothetical protein